MIARYIIAACCLLAGILAGAADIVLSKGYSVQGVNVVISTTTTTTIPAAKVVTGDGAYLTDPYGSPNGNYLEDGIYNGGMSYKRADGVFCIFQTVPGGAHYISAIKGDTSACWRNTAEVPDGDYTALVQSAGTCTVSNP